MRTEYLTRKEVCELLGISESTFSRCRIGDKLTPYKVGKRIKYKRSDIEKLRIGKEKYER